MLLRVASGVLCSVAANVYIYYGRVYSICFLTLRFALLCRLPFCPLLPIVLVHAGCFEGV